MSTPHEVYVGIDSCGTDYLYPHPPEVSREMGDVVYTGDFCAELATLERHDVSDVLGFEAVPGRCYEITFYVKEVQL